MAHRVAGAVAHEVRGPAELRSSPARSLRSDRDGVHRRLLEADDVDCRHPDPEAALGQALHG